MDDASHKLECSQRNVDSLRDLVSDVKQSCSSVVHFIDQLKVLKNMPHTTNLPASLLHEPPEVTAEILFHMVNASPVICCELIAGNNDPTIIKATGVLERMFGYGSGQLHGEPISQLIPFDKAAAHLSHVANFFASPIDRQMGELSYRPEGRHRDGHTFAIEVMLHPFWINRRMFVNVTIMPQLAAQVAT